MKNTLNPSFALLLVLLAVSYYFNRRAIAESQRTQSVIAEAQGVRIEILALLLAYVNAETGQRGFLLTGDERYLEPYERAQKQLESENLRLKSLFAPESTLEALRNRVSPLGRAKFATLAVIERVLHRAGAEVRTSTNVPEALSLLSAWPAELVISDIGMPDHDGYLFVRELRDHPKAAIRELRTIALTAFARDHDRKDAVDAGFNDHLSKPVETVVLLAKVARVSARA